MLKIGARSSSGTSVASACRVTKIRSPARAMFCARVQTSVLIRCGRLAVFGVTGATASE